MGVAIGVIERILRAQIGHGPLSRIWDRLLIAQNLNIDQNLTTSTENLDDGQNLGSPPRIFKN